MAGIRYLLYKVFSLFDKNGKFLDFAGGYGVFVRLMRNRGFDFAWTDLYAENLFARGFEYREGKIELITSFESFEHFVNPLEEIEKMLAVSSNILFSTELLPQPTPKPENWWYYGLQYRQHISFYSTKTLQTIANYFGLNLYTNNLNIHLLTKKKINPFFYRLLVSRWGRYFSYPVKKYMKSKTWEDYLLLSK